jgi:Ras-related GTP-binding protein A/B
VVGRYKHLTTFAQACSATEAILFERTAFLIIATSARDKPRTT